jgi:hypothetical protein
MAGRAGHAGKEDSGKSGTCGKRRQWEERDMREKKTAGRAGRAGKEDSGKSGKRCKRGSVKRGRNGVLL